jgi:hypothetical protein
MIGDLAVIVPGALGALCVVVVCAVYWRKQGFGQGGALLSLCGLALLGLAYWQAGAQDRAMDAQDRAMPDLARRLDAIAAAMARLEAQVARIIERRAEPAAAGTSGATPGEDTSRAESAPAGGQDDDAPASAVLEIEVEGGVSDAKLAAIVAWIEQVKAEHRTSRISIEPVMPLQSADPDGQRATLMSEAGRVIDHVFAALRQRVDIGRLVLEDVPGPRLRLGLSDA